MHRRRNARPLPLLLAALLLVAACSELPGVDVDTSSCPNDVPLHGDTCEVSGMVCHYAVATCADPSEMECGGDGSWHLTAGCQGAGGSGGASVASSGNAVTGQAATGAYMTAGSGGTSFVSSSSSSSTGFGGEYVGASSSSSSGAGGGTVCDATQFMCNDGTCIPLSYLCEEPPYNDCSEGEDESPELCG